jgi:hypothetical protein
MAPTPTHIRTLPTQGKARPGTPPLRSSTLQQRDESTYTASIHKSEQLTTTSKAVQVKSALVARKKGQEKNGDAHASPATENKTKDMYPLTVALAVRVCAEPVVLRIIAARRDYRNVH